MADNVMAASARQIVRRRFVELLLVAPSPFDSQVATLAVGQAARLDSAQNNWGILEALPEDDEQTERETAP